MKISRRMRLAFAGLIISAGLLAWGGITVRAGNEDYLDGLTGGVSSVIDPGATNAAEAISTTAEQIGDADDTEEEHFDKVMANVKSALNIRSDASEDAEIVGKLYKDCGGTILERRDGWTRIQSGNVIGWASDRYLLFDEEAEALAKDVGKLIAYVNKVLRVREEQSKESGVLGVLPKGEMVEVLEIMENDWVRIDYEGQDGYVSAEYVTLDFLIDTAESTEEIKARKEAEKAAKLEAERHKNYGQYTTDADTTLLLAALIQCEAGGESYEGKLAVGAVVMNRVRSGAYPDSIHGVIYASGQFTPAMNGKLNRVYESGKINEECIKAAQEALSGVSNVGDLTHFRRNNGRDGLVIGNHVFY